MLYFKTFGISSSGLKVDVTWSGSVLMALLPGPARVLGPPSWLCAFWVTQGAQPPQATQRHLEGCWPCCSQPLGANGAGQPCMTQLLPTAHLACWLFPALNLTRIVPRGRNTLHGVPDLATTAILVLLQGLIRLSSHLGWFQTTCPTRTPAVKLMPPSPVPKTYTFICSFMCRFSRCQAPCSITSLRVLLAVSPSQTC